VLGWSKRPIQNLNMEDLTVALAHLETAYTALSESTEASPSEPTDAEFHRMLIESGVSPRDTPWDELNFHLISVHQHLR
jgi:hypothetical protein